MNTTALHDRHRSNLYARLNQLAHESTFVFCGYGIGDAHIRNILHRLEADGIKRLSMPAEFSSERPK